MSLSIFSLERWPNAMTLMHDICPSAPHKRLARPSYNLDASVTGRGSYLSNMPTCAKSMWPIRGAVANLVFRIRVRLEADDLSCAVSIPRRDSRLPEHRDVQELPTQYTCSQAIHVCRKYLNATAAPTFQAPARPTGLFLKDLTAALTLLGSPAVRSVVLIRPLNRYESQPRRH